MGDPRSSLYATGAASAGGVSARAPRGLPCRYSPCRELFAAFGMSSSTAVLREVAAVRDAHELDAHGGIYRAVPLTPAPRRFVARGRRSL